MIINPICYIFRLSNIKWITETAIYKIHYISDKQLLSFKIGKNKLSAKKKVMIFVRKNTYFAI